MAKKKHSAPAIGAANTTGAAPVALVNPASRGDRLFAACIVDYGTLAGLRETGRQLRTMDTVERHRFVESLDGSEDEVQAHAVRILRTASSEIDAHLLIERIRTGRARLLRPI
ncbi:MAG: hypothetical protein H0W48_06030 [Methylibium sp.]|nr:hypothetical protein [Methylibium sp.]